MSLAKPSSPRLQFGHPLAQGLVLAAAFSEGSGLTVNDFSSYQTPGTLTNGSSAPIWQGGRTGWALSSGVNSYITFGPSPSLQPAYITIAIGCVLTTSNPLSVLIAQGMPNQFFHGYEIFTDANRVLFDIGYGATNRVTSSGPAGLTLVDYNFIVASYDGTNQLLYLNDILVASAAPAGGQLTYTNQPTWIGNDQFNGALSANTNWESCFVWNRALSVAEISQLFEDPYAPVRPRRRWNKPAAFVTHSTNLTDAVGLADTPAVKTTTNRQVLDAAGLVDSPAIEATTNRRPMSDAAGLADSPIVETTTQRKISDGLGIADLVPVMLPVIVRVQVVLTGGMADSGATPLGRQTRRRDSYTEDDSYPVYRDHFGRAATSWSGRSRVRWREGKVEPVARAAPDDPRPFTKEWHSRLAGLHLTATARLRYIDGAVLRKAEAMDEMILLLPLMESFKSKKEEPDASV